MQNKMSQKSFSMDMDSVSQVPSVFAENILLFIGCAAWWGSHYLLLWNITAAQTNPFTEGYDGRFILTIAATVLVLGIVVFISLKRPSFRLDTHSTTYVLFGLLSIIALVMIYLSSLGYIPPVFAALGAVISGIGNGLLLVPIGELHARLKIHFLPLLFAAEMFSGVLLFGLLFFLDPLYKMVADMALIAIAACTLFAFSRRKVTKQDDTQVAFLDMSLLSLTILAVLIGCGYGLMRTLSFGVSQGNDMLLGLGAECLGTCFCLLLLVAVFLFQAKQTIFDICLLFVVPLVATGIFLVSLQGIFCVVPKAINVGGFVCFFALMWYFAAIFSTRPNAKSITFYSAALFLASQSGQLLGAVVPPFFTNTLSSSLVYLILVVAMILLYWRSRKKPGLLTSENLNLASNDESDVKKYFLPIAERFGFSSREAEVVLLLTKRMPYRQISEELFISENTVKTHVRSIYKKVGVSSREELVESIESLAKKG